MAQSTARRRNPATSRRSTSSGRSRTSSVRSWRPRSPGGLGNIIGVILLVVAAFVAGYLVGRAGPPVLAAEEPALVSKVVDGDTIQLADGSVVRYLCVDCPEQGEPYYSEATARNRQLVEGKAVELVQGVRDSDDAGHLLRYVYVDGVLVNAVLVEEGLASVLEHDPGEVHLQLLRSLEEEASLHGRGLWAVS